MRQYFVFGGTTEGRLIARELLEQGNLVHLSVATEYGEEVLKNEDNLIIHQGRLDQEAMRQLLASDHWEAVIDATHPYAIAVSENIKTACEAVGCSYFRLLRENVEESQKEGICHVDSREEAVAYLNQREGNILFTTGTKDLPFYVTGIRDISRIYVRVLADVSAVEQCRKLGLLGRQIICMQGPFSKEMNAAMLSQIQAAFLVTKDGGKTGGLPEKIEGAKIAGAKVILLRRPVEEGLEIKELRRRLSLPEPNRALEKEEKGRITEEKRKITLLGIGMGNLQDLTLEGENACKEADVILGAARMTEALRGFQKETAAIYQPDKVMTYLEEHPEKQRVVVAFSGDVGFYSGTKKLLDLFKEKSWEVRLIPGISSVVFFASRLKMPWEDMKLVSVHGRTQNLLGAVRTHRKVFSLAGYKESVQKLAKILQEAGLGYVKMSVGCQLGYPEEKICTGTPENMMDFQEEGLCVLVLENDRADQTVVTHGLPDETFERGNAPMTKEEIRSISLSKLMLTKEAIVYDVGAGTGSIGLECALQAVDGIVYAVEKKADALALLVKNKKRLGISNLEIVEGMAPQALEELQAPTHAFIGGSSGNMKEIIETLLSKNPQVRIVINCIALETVAEVMNILKEKKFQIQDIVHAAIGKSKTLGSYHMMMGQNPVYIITLQGEEG